jgi:hypothetical protein
MAHTAQYRQILKELQALPVEARRVLRLLRLVREEFRPRERSISQERVSPRVMPDAPVPRLIVEQSHRTLLLSGKIACERLVLLRYVGLVKLYHQGSALNGWRAVWAGRKTSWSSWVGHR